MIIILLIIIASCLLFGGDKTKTAIGVVIDVILVILGIGCMVSCLGGS